MANTLTNLIPDAYEAMDVVARELVGFIPAVTMNASAARAAVNQVIRSHVAPASTASDVTPGTTPPDDGDQTIGNKSLTITNSRGVPFRWTGEEELGVDAGPGTGNVRADQIAQAVRTLVNEVEVDLGLLAYKASRAYGTAATTPFASTLADPAQLRKILVDNGAPDNNLQLVIDSTAGAALRTLAQLTKVNEAGDSSLLRQGILLPLHNFDVRESAGVANPTVGTGASATTNTAGYAIGATVITLASAGTGTITAGEVITFTGDTNKYIVTSGDADVSNGGTITLSAPGLRKALPASAVAITVVAKSTRNLGFHRSAIHLAARAPALPKEGDMASDRTILQDPRSGLAFEFAMYPQYRRIRYEVSLAWGCELMKPEFAAVLLGQA